MERDQSCDHFQARVQERLSIHADWNSVDGKYNSMLAAEAEVKRKLDNNELSKAELLHHLRGWREAFHRSVIENGFENHILCWNAKPLPGQPENSQTPTTNERQRIQLANNKVEYRWFDDFFELANKSVPFYLLLSADWSLTLDLQRSLCNYFYAKWFRPYKSDIEFNQFPLKLVVPVDMRSDNMGRPSAEAIATLCLTTKWLSRYIDKGKRGLAEDIEFSAAKNHFSPLSDFHRHYYFGPGHDRCEPNLGGYYWQFNHRVMTPQRLARHYSRSSLFGSVGIVLCLENALVKRNLVKLRREENDEFLSQNIGKTSVCLFLTGENDPELSAPVTFDGIADDKIQAVLQHGPKKAIQTTLDTAIEFIIALEEREAAAVKENATDTEAETFYATPVFPESYDHLFEGDSILTGPSSKWVNTETYTKWTGKGAVLDYQEYMIEKDCWPRTVSGSMVNTPPEVPERLSEDY